MPRCGLGTHHQLVVVWNDAGNESKSDHIPVPKTEEFVSLASELRFCPVFFENDLAQQKTSESIPQTKDEASEPLKQPLILLNSQYGATIDWSSSGVDSPLFALVELLSFDAAAVSQYLNMLEDVLLDVSSRCQYPSYEHTKLETLLHYDYVKTAAVRLSHNLKETIVFMEHPSASWCSNVSEESDSAWQTTALALNGDFAHLLSRTNALVKLCEDGKSTLIGNASIQEAKRSAEEARLVTELTKATNRLTFIFLPISFVTSVFGMNFKQFGQGQLSIWVWAVITVPLLVISMALVERGRMISDRLRRMMHKLPSSRN
jgi:hypothetical protein